MRRMACLVVVLILAACAEEPPAPLEHRFAERPARLVASSRLPDACIASLMQSLLWYRDQGATLTLEVKDPLDDGVLDGVVVAGEIGVIPDIFTDAPAYGADDALVGAHEEAETRVSLTIGGNIQGAEISLESCAPLVVAHEIGHALGLVDLYRVEPPNLMNDKLEHDVWQLNAEQLAWIGD